MSNICQWLPVLGGNLSLGTSLPISKRWSYHTSLTVLRDFNLPCVVDVELGAKKEKKSHKICDRIFKAFSCGMYSQEVLYGSFKWGYAYWRFNICSKCSKVHITCHLSWASGGGTTNSLSYVLYISVSHSQYHAEGMINSNQSIIYRH